MYKAFWLSALCIGGLLPVVTAQGVRGEYVEARTCSVYAGGCHYSGEYVTAGREALVFWHIQEGSWKGVDLSGVSVLAAVVADNNLAEPSAKRQSVIYLDERANVAQRNAIVALLSARYAHLLGTVREVKIVSVIYSRRERELLVSAPGIAELNVSRYPCQHCVQPHQIWYQPLIPLERAEVAAAKRAAYYDRVLGAVWQRGEENSVFVGEFEWR